MQNPQATDKSFEDVFFSTQPFRNNSEGLAVFGASLLGAVIVPVAISIMEPFILLGLIAALLVSFVSSVSYLYHDSTGDKQYLDDNADYYKKLHQTTTILLLLTVVPPLCWSIGMIGNAIYRGLATLCGSEYQPVTNHRGY
ncbi:MAG: hypothetical protein EBQ95_04615 [Gammaproteobacteria bacterium]|nr:hypothetical protein [Gammaproteobacteria bacterium]